ncbi:MAG: tryptophan synthase subunit alpha [Pseudomonadales bacterium]|nr:tryptophan synthase subunit alpha [Pseudomonadales bacterium]
MSEQREQSVAPHERITAAITAANTRGQPAIVAFLTAGYPAKDKFRAHLTEIGAAADVVEIGVPFTDPMADGMTIQRSSQGALAQGVTLRWLLGELHDMPRPQAPLILMSYLNPLLAFGFDELPAAAQRAGICGFIVPDLPYDESDDFRRALRREGVALIQMATPVTTDKRLREVAAVSEGFLYAVTMTGTTGKSVAVPQEVTTYLDRVTAVSPVPVCAGFGIRSVTQVRDLQKHVAGVIVGSALVEVLEQGGDPGAFLRSLRPGE